MPIRLPAAEVGRGRPYPEINAVLDRLTAEPHPLAEDLELLEEHLNSLAQAAMEAELEVEGRTGG
ncbi:MAG: hypothetical protein ACRDHD_02105 [Candidatus Limnocylindria bacterium]